MSEIKGYSIEKIAETRKTELEEDYNFCKKKLAEIRRHEEEINSIRIAYNKKLLNTG